MKGNSAKNTNLKFFKSIKPIVFLTFLIVLFVALCGCSSGKHTVTEGSINFSDGVLSGQYNQFDGDYIVRWNFKLNELGHFEITTDTKGGEIEFFLIDRNEEERQIVNGDTYRLKNGGSVVKLIARGKQHSGSFSVKFVV